MVYEDKQDIELNNEQLYSDQLYEDIGFTDNFREQLGDTSLDDELSDENPESLTQDESIPRTATNTEVEDFGERLNPDTDEIDDTGTAAGTEDKNTQAGKEDELAKQ